MIAVARAETPETEELYWECCARACRKGNGDGEGESASAIRGGVGKGLGVKNGSLSPGVSGAEEEQGTSAGINGGGVREEGNESSALIDSFAQKGDVQECTGWNNGC